MARFPLLLMISGLLGSLALPLPLHARDHWMWLDQGENESAAETTATTLDPADSVASDFFVAGDVRTVAGGQSVLLDAVSRQSMTAERFLELLFGTVDFNESSLEILVSSAEQFLAQFAATSDSSFSFQASASLQHVVFFSPVLPVGSGIFYAAQFTSGADFDVLTDGFTLLESNTNSVTFFGNSFIGFTHATSVTGDCLDGCTFSQSDLKNPLVEAAGRDAPHGVSWAVVLPPFELGAPDAHSPNGALAYIAADHLAPRSELPTNGIATYDTVIGGNAPMHPTQGTGALDSFSATVDFGTAQVTSVALNGRFDPTETFSVTNSGGPAGINADGTFASTLAGTCSFCVGGALSGHLVGGFVAGGDALLAAYGLRGAPLAGSQDSIAGSVLATE